MTTSNFNDILTSIIGIDYELISASFNDKLAELTGKFIVDMNELSSNLKNRIFSLNPLKKEYFYNRIDNLSGKIDSTIEISNDLSAKIGTALSIYSSLSNEYNPIYSKFITLSSDLISSMPSSLSMMENCNDYNSLSNVSALSTNIVNSIPVNVDGMTNASSYLKNNNKEISTTISTLFGKGSTTALSTISFANYKNGNLSAKFNGKISSYYIKLNNVATPINNVNIDITRIQNSIDCVSSKYDGLCEAINSISGIIDDLSAKLDDAKENGIRQITDTIKFNANVLSAIITSNTSFKVDTSNLDFNRIYKTSMIIDTTNSTSDNIDVTIDNKKIATFKKDEQHLIEVECVPMTLLFDKFNIFCKLVF